jgi:hypothetical protein
MAKVAKGQTLIEIANHHGDPAPEITVGPDDYVSYFENEHGEQWLFVRAHGADTGTVYGGDLGWESHEVRFRSPDEVRAELTGQGIRGSMIDRMMALTRPDPLLPGVVLGDGEKAWLNTAWWASSGLDRQEALAAVADAVVGQLPSDLRKGLNEHPNATAHRGAMVVLAMLAGQAAGMRGMTEAEAAGLYEQVLDRIDAKS